MIDYNDSAKQYLIDRGIHPDTIKRLDFHWIPKAKASGYGYSSKETSPDGLIVIPLIQNRTKSYGRNFYSREKSKEEHLESLNRNRQCDEPISKVSKYLSPFGDRNKDYPYYDSYPRLHDGKDLPEPLFATEDIIGVTKAAQNGYRILSTFGVWVVTNEQLSCQKNDPNWEHPLKGKFPAYIADSDCFEKVGVFCAVVRTGYVIDCKVGVFNSDNPKEKVGLDEYIDKGGDLNQIKGRDVRDFVIKGLKRVISVHEELYSDKKEREQKLSEFYGQVERELKNHDLELLHDTQMKALTAFFKGMEKSKNSAKIDSDDPTKVLLQIANQGNYFHTPDKESYVDILINEYRHTYKVQSKDFKQWLIHEYYKKREHAPSSYYLNDVLSTLEARAICEGEQREVYLRIAEYEGNIYLDLGTPDCLTVEVSSEGWDIVSNYPVRFRRPNTLLALPIPKKGNLDELRELLNLDEQSWVLTITFLLFCFYPKYPHPILILHGEKGSGKSTIAEFLKSLIDPGKAPLMNQINDERDLAIAANNRWLLVYDNLSGISPQKSDALCQISTGGGFSTRTLHTNDEETVFEFMRPQIITGIDSLATRGDLLERSLLVNLPSISEGKRCTREELESKLNEARPRILGALLTALSQTLKALPDTKPDGLPRMADYAKFAIASEAALGLEPGAFLKAFNSNRDEAHEIALESSPVAQVIIDFVQTNSKWSGTASELLNMLNRMGHESTNSRYWPKSPAYLGKAINRITPDLRSVGIVVEFQRSSKERIITIEKIITEQNQKPENHNSTLDLPFKIKPEQDPKGKHVTGHRTRLK